MPLRERLRSSSNNKLRTSSLCLLVALLSACLTSVLSYDQTRGPPDTASLRVPWNVTGKPLRLDGCQINASQEYCDFQFFKAKFVFLEDKILIGARNQLHVVDKAFQTIRNVVWNPDKEKKTVCETVSSDVKRETDCENYIKFVEPYPNDPGRLLICGTFSLYRACLTVNASLALTPGETIMLDSGVDSIDTQFGFFAQRASDNSIVTFVGDRRNDSALLAVSPPLSSAGHYHISFINSTFGANDTVSFSTVESVDTTQQHFIEGPVEFREQFETNYFNSTGLNDGSTDNGELDFEFLLYNENAKEVNAGEETRYARLARICKNDGGVEHFTKKHFQTFVKARLVCKSDNSGGDVRHLGRFFYYDRITTGRLHKGTSVGSGMGWNTEQVFYGGFAGHGLGPKGSAICIYNATRSPPGQDNHGIFDIYGADYYRENERPYANSQPFKCTKDPRNKDDALSQTLIHRPAMPIDEAPVVVIDNYLINTLVVDTVPVIVEHNTSSGHRLGLQDVIFAGMDSGEIFKVFANRTITHRSGSTPQPVYSEIIELADNEPTPVTDLALQDEKGERYLYVMTYTSAYRLPLQRCARFSDCSSCVLAKDPYCFWDTRDWKCTTLPKNVTGFTTRFVQILADETDDSICVQPRESSSFTTLTMATSSVHSSPSSAFLEVPTPTPSPSAAVVSATPSASHPPPQSAAPSVLPSPNIDPLLIQPVQSTSGLTLFIVGILFLIIGASLIAISALVLFQHRKMCAVIVRRTGEEGQDHKPPLPSKMYAPPLDDGNRVSPSSSINSSDIEAVSPNGAIPSTEESKSDGYGVIMPTNSLTETNGCYHHSVRPTDTANASLEGVPSLTPTEECSIQISPGTFEFDVDLTHSSDA